MLQTSLLLRKSLNKTDTPIFFICSLFFVSKGNLFDVYFTTLQLVLVPCCGGRTSPRNLPECRLYFISFGIIGPTVETLKMEFCSCIR